MAKKRQKLSIKDILKGKFLIEGNAQSTWRFLFFMIALGFLSIYSSHVVDKKVVEIRRLKDSVRELNSEYASVHQKLMEKQRLSNVKKKVNKYGLTPPKKRPYKIEY